MEQPSRRNGGEASAAAAEASEVALLRKERDVYLSLLGLGRDDGRDVHSVLLETLEVVVERTGATRAFVGVYSDAWQRSDAPIWQAVYPPDAGGFSSTLIEDALAARRSVQSEALSEDPRFHNAVSVRLGTLQAALCVPFPSGLGVIYVQDRKGGGGFSPIHTFWLEEIARIVAPLVQRMRVLEPPRASGDPTAPWRRGGRFSGVVGRSRALASVFEQAVRAIDLRAPAIVLWGEPGTGRSALAAAIHASSERAPGPLRVLPCASIDPASCAAVLLGDRTREGAFEGARGGTLVLHELEELPTQGQALVQAFLEGTLDPGLGVADPPDVRVIALLSGSPDDAVRSRRLRAGLGARLSPHVIAVPTLAARAEDLPLLLDDAGVRLARRHHLAWQGVDPEVLAGGEVLRWARSHHQLERLVERALVACSGERPLTLEDLRPESGKRVRPEVQVQVNGPLPTWGDAKDLLGAALLRLVLDRHGGNVSASAVALGVARPHLSSLITRLGVRHLADDSLD